MLKGELKAALANFGEGVAMCRNLGQMRNLVVTLCNYSLSEMIMGDLDQAEQHVREALRVAMAFSDVYPRAFATQCLGEVRAAKGFATEGIDLLIEARAMYKESSVAEMVLESELNIAEASASSGHIAAAKEFLRTLKDEGAFSQDQLPRFGMLKARMAMLEGDEKRARAEIAETIKITRERDLRYWEGRALLFIYELEKRFGTAERAESALKEAERVLRLCDVPSVTPFLVGRSSPGA
jgi:ATP/maltotriose-dependent transcriptional regulator MalT